MLTALCHQVNTTRLQHFQQCVHYRFPHYGGRLGTNSVAANFRGGTPHNEESAGWYLAFLT